MQTTLVLELEPKTLADVLRDLAERGCQVAVHAATGAAETAIKPPAVDYDAVRTRLFLAGLTPRECDVVVLDLQGHSRADIAARCGVGPASVKKYWQAIYSKIGVQCRSALRAWALEGTTR